MPCPADYSRKTAQLGENVERYFTLDAFDPERPKLVKVGACPLWPMKNRSSRLNCKLFPDQGIAVSRSHLPCIDVHSLQWQVW